MCVSKVISNSNPKSFFAYESDHPMPTKNIPLQTANTTKPHLLLVKWDSGWEEIDLNLIEAARTAPHTDGKPIIRTYEQRNEDGRVVAYEPALEITTDSFSLGYSDAGYWVDDLDMIQPADGELGEAKYTRKNGKWECNWHSKDDSDNPIKIDCKLAEQVRDTRQTNAKVRMARFRSIILKGVKACIVTGETDKRNLDAAHIHEVTNEGEDVRLNGLPMRKDIHALFDRHILTIADDGTVSMNEVPETYKYLFTDKACTTWKKDPKDEINELPGRLGYIKERNKIRLEKAKGKNIGSNRP